MTVFIVYDLRDHSVAFVTDELARARGFVNDAFWPMEKGRYTCPFEIHDSYVHTKDCTCSRHCGGSKEDE